MNSSKLKMVLVSVIFCPISAFSFTGGCNVNGVEQPFTSPHHEGAEMVYDIQITPDLYVEYTDVSNLQTLAVVENNNVVASKSDMMERILLKVDVENYKIVCNVSP